MIQEIDTKTPPSSSYVETSGTVNKVPLQTDLDIIDNDMNNLYLQLFGIMVQGETPDPATLNSLMAQLVTDVGTLTQEATKQGLGESFMSDLQDLSSAVSAMGNDLTKAEASGSQADWGQVFIDTACDGKIQPITDQIQEMIYNM